MFLRVHFIFLICFFKNLFRMSVRYFGVREAQKTGQETVWTVPTLLSWKTISWSGMTWLVGEFFFFKTVEGVYFFGDFS